MYCSKCGKEIKKESKFCSHCGNESSTENQSVEIENANSRKTSTFIFFGIGLLACLILAVVGKYFDNSSLAFNIGAYIGVVLVPLIISYVITLIGKRKNKGKFNINSFALLFMALSLVLLLLLGSANL